MASTARSKRDCKEFFDSDEDLMKKVKQTAALLKESKHAIAFTGAGISTAAGIPDFRSGVNTVLATGPGKWEREAHMKTSKPKSIPAPKQRTEVLKAYPTYTHMALKKLVNEGILKCLISQNTDGLHLRSGIPKKNFAELHGNTNLEVCSKCGQEYLRDYRTRKLGVKVKEHLTGRRCDNAKCRGPLRDSIINFGENLPDHEITHAEMHSKVADFCIALGSSLTVTPAADFPENVGRKKFGDLCIVNLQNTPLDCHATHRLNGKCDDVMRMLMKELNLEVEEWKMERAVKIEMKTWKSLEISGVNLDTDTPYSLFKAVQYDNQKILSPSPFNFKVEGIKNPGAKKLELTFFGHYDEPNLQLPAESGVYKIWLDFTTMRWTVEKVL